MEAFLLKLFKVKLRNFEKFLNFAWQNQETKNFIILCPDTVNGQP